MSLQSFEKETFKVKFKRNAWSLFYLLYCKYIDLMKSIIFSWKCNKNCCRLVDLSARESWSSRSESSLMRRTDQNTRARTRVAADYLLTLLLRCYLLLASYALPRYHSVCVHKCIVQCLTATKKTYDVVSEKSCSPGSRWFTNKATMKLADTQIICSFSTAVVLAMTSWAVDLTV